MMRVVFTAAAEADLETIADWIAQDNPRRALTFVSELRETCEALADAPFGYPFVPRYEGTGTRRQPHRNYLIFYRTTDRTIEVLHVLHGARDYEFLLFPDD